jgi:hypothetical protein
METRRAAIHRKMPTLPRRLPITGSAHKAGVVGATHQSAIRAGLSVAAQCRRPAQLDGAHHAPFDAAQVSVMGTAISAAVAAEDIRHFQTGRHDADRSGGRHDLQRQAVEWALGPPDQGVRDPRIARRGREVAVTQRPRAIMLIYLCH